MIDSLSLDNTAIHIFSSNDGGKYYAGVIEDGYFINYDTKEFINLIKK